MVPLLLSPSIQCENNFQFLIVGFRHFAIWTRDKIVLVYYGIRQNNANRYDKIVLGHYDTMTVFLNNIS